MIIQNRKLLLNHLANTRKNFIRYVKDYYL